MAGGGSSLIITPILLMMGFPLPVIIGSGAVAGSVWVLVAARNYLRGHEIDWRLVAGLVACGLPGAFLGTRVIVWCNPKDVQQFIGAIIVALVVSMFLRKDFGLQPTAPKVSRALTSLAGFPLGFYEAFFGAGNSFFVCSVLTNARGLQLQQALGYSYLLAFFWLLWAAALYVHGGHWSLSLVVPSIVGALGGAFIGSHFGVKRGIPFTKTLFAIVGGFLGMKFMLGL